MADRKNDSTEEHELDPLEAELTIQSAPLEPIRVVERELIRPDGSTVVVEVPVYPPFKLEAGEKPRATSRGRKSASASK